MVLLTCSSASIASFMAPLTANLRTQNPETPKALSSTNTSSCGFRALKGVASGWLVNVCPEVVGNSLSADPYGKGLCHRVYPSRNSPYRLHEGPENTISTADSWDQIPYKVVSMDAVGKSEERTRKLAFEVDSWKHA